jgi:hypothetical protein
MTFNDYEFQRLESFVNHLSKQKPDVSSSGQAIGYLMSIFKLRYFEFIPKDSTYRTKELFKLVMDLKTIEKSYNIKSYIIGFNFLYFSLLLDKRRKIFSLRMLSTLLLTNVVILIQQYYFYNRIFQAMDPLLKHDIEYLYYNLKREREGFDKKVECIFIVRQ